MLPDGQSSLNSLSEVEDPSSVTYHRGENSRTKVTGGVNGPSGLQANTSTDGQNGEEQAQWNQASRRWTVVPVGDGAYGHEKHERSKELVPET